MENQNPTQPIQTPLASPVATPSVPPKKRSRLKWAIAGIIGIIVLALIALLGPSYYYALPYLLDKYDTSKSPSIAPQISLSPKVIAGWKNFAGQYVGISFQYPSTWYEVNSEYVSQVPTKDVFETNFISYRDKGKKADLVAINRYSPDIESASYSKVLKRFETIKSAKLDKETVDKEEGDVYRKKVAEGKISSGQDYVTFLTYMYDYKLENPKDENSKEIKVPNIWALSSYVKEKNVVYTLDLEYYDDEGSNIFSNMIKTAKINSQIPKLKIYSDGEFSFSYPSYSKIVKGEKGLSITPVKNSDFYYNSIFVRNNFIDPKLFPEGNIKQKGTWWHEAICKYMSDRIDDFGYINGYPSNTVQTEYQPNYFDIYILNKPYILHFSTQDEHSVKFIKDMVSNVKFSKENKVIDDPNVLAYLKAQPARIQDRACEYK